jgi:hypothetical protein
VTVHLVCTATLYDVVWFESELDSPPSEGGTGPPTPIVPQALVASEGRSNLVPH